MPTGLKGPSPTYGQSMKCVYCLEKELHLAICGPWNARINLLRLTPRLVGLYLRTHGYQLQTPADKASESLWALVNFGV